MSSIDIITTSFKAAWSGGGSTGLCPASAIYYDRPQKPAQLSGFPYMGLNVEEIDHETPTKPATNYSLVRYRLTVDVWTCQGQTGGATSGDQMTDQGNLQRGLDAVLNFIAPNVPWQSMPEFLHCIKEPGMRCGKDEELYLGKDVLKSSQSWEIYTTE